MMNILILSEKITEIVNKKQQIDKLSKSYLSMMQYGASDNFKMQKIKAFLITYSS